MSQALSMREPTIMRTSHEQSGGMLPLQTRQEDLTQMPPNPTPYQSRAQPRDEELKGVPSIVRQECVRPPRAEGVGSAESKQMLRDRAGSAAFRRSPSLGEEQLGSTRSHLAQWDEKYPVEAQAAMTSQVPENGSGKERPVTGHEQSQQRGRGGIGAAESIEETQRRLTARATESSRKSRENQFPQTNRPSQARVPEKDKRGMGIRAASLSQLQQHGERGESPTKRPLRKRQDEGLVVEPLTGLPQIPRDKVSGVGATATPPQTMQTLNSERRPTMRPSRTLQNQDPKGSLSALPTRTPQDQGLGAGVIAKPSQTPQPRKPEGRLTPRSARTLQDERPGGRAGTVPVPKEQVESPRAEAARRKHQERMRLATHKSGEETLRRKQEQDEKEEQEAKAKLAEGYQPAKPTPVSVMGEQMQRTHITDEETRQSDLRLLEMRKAERPARERKAQ